MTAFKGWMSSKNLPFSKFPFINFPDKNIAFNLDGCLSNLIPGTNQSNTINGAINPSIVPFFSSSLFINISANQVIYSEADAAFNNKPSLRDTLSAMNSNVPILLYPDSYTIALVYKINSINGSKNYFAGQNLNTVGAIVLADNANTRGFGILSTPALFNPAPADTNPHIVVCTPYDLMQDGVLEASSVFTPMASIINRLFWTANVGISERANSSLASFVIYRNVLNQDDMLKLSTELNSVFAIY